MKPVASIAVLPLAAMLVGVMPLARAQSGPAAPAATAPAAASCPRAQQMGQHMQRMQALRDRLAKATTAQERERIRTEQRQAMREGMTMMRGTGMGPRAGMGMGPGGGMGMGGMGPCAGERMAMMETMMELMLDQTEPAKGK